MVLRLPCKLNWYAASKVGKSKMAMKSSAIVHALPYPVLEAGNLSFPSGSYETEVVVGSDGHSATVTHTISGTPFIEQLVADGTAEFYCHLSIPKSGVRRLIKTGRHGSCEWDADIVGESPKLQPVVLYIGDEAEHELPESNDVAEIWQGRKVILPKGARLARGDFFNVNSSDHSFIRFKEDMDYSPGTFRVQESHEDGFYFTVWAHGDIVKFVQHYGDNDELRVATLTGIVAYCFSMLKNWHSSNDDDTNRLVEFPNLKLLSAKLEEEIGWDWTDENFDPVLAATTMYPIRVPAPQPDDNGEGE